MAMLNNQMVIPENWKLETPNTTNTQPSLKK